MYVLLFSPPIPRLLYWSENCVEVTGQAGASSSSSSAQVGQTDSHSNLGTQESERTTTTHSLVVDNLQQRLRQRCDLGNNKTNDPIKPTTRCFHCIARASHRFIQTPYCLTMCASKKLLMIATSICASASFAFLCIAVATDYWIHMTELKLTENGTTIHVNTSTGLWKRCEVDETKLAQGQVCSYINYWDTIESEGLGPVESIILSLRRCVVFPVLGVLILLAGEIICFIGHCNHRKKMLTFVAGIIYVVGGLCTLVGIILFIGSITEEAGHKPKSKGMDEDPFTYNYGASFNLTVASFVISELTGVLSVYLYISRHKHAYKKKQERMTLNDSRSNMSNSRNFHESRSLSRERSHDESPTHSDTYYTYTPVSESSKDISNYTFPRDPSRYTIPDTRVYRGQSQTHSSHSVHDTDTYANRREVDTNSRRDLDTHSQNRREMDTYSQNRRDVDTYSQNRRDVDTYSQNRRDVDTYSQNRREMDTYSQNRRDMDTYSRRTTPV